MPPTELLGLVTVIGTTRSSVYPGKVTSPTPIETSCVNAMFNTNIDDKKRFLTVFNVDTFPPTFFNQ
jgi:hypothetical protein